MSWLNLNESFTNIKGQISNFANNVLAESEEIEVDLKNSYEELKTVCEKQQKEIEELRKLTEFNGAGTSEKIQNGENTNDAWSWNTDKVSNPIKPQDNLSEETISNLKKQVKLIENEKNDLINQLELLDSENQQNISELVTMRDKLQEENCDLKEKYTELSNKHKNVTNKEEKIRKEYNQLQKQLENFKQNNLNQDDPLLLENQQLKIEAEQVKKELATLKSTSSTLEKTLEQSKISTENEVTELVEKIKKLEAENKIMYAELEKSKQSIKEHENRSIEDTENCQKLALILESYEEQVRKLKNELETNHQQASNQEEIDKLKQDLHILQKNCHDIQLEKEELLKKTDLEIQELKASFNKSQEKIIIQENTITNYTKELENLRNDFDKFTNENTYLLNKNKELEEEVNQLQKEKEELEKNLEKINLDTDKSIELVTLQAEFELLKSNYETVLQEIDSLRKNLEEKELELEKNSKECSDLKQDIEAQKVRYEALLLEKQNVQEKDCNKLIETLQKLKDTDNSEFLNSITEDLKSLNLNDQLVVILKILLNIKNNNEELKQKLFEISQEKTSILNEKNHEIEKLIQNSEILSQDIITKSDTIKYYEAECSELVKNNELLISELETYKNNSGLQTISESNEDNMVLLENELETANKHITELEKQLQSSKIEEDTDKTETEIIKKKKDYQELLNSFDDLQIEFDTMKKDLDNSKEELNYVNSENEELKATLERLRGDFENTEYQLQETCVELESSNAKGSELLQDVKNLQLVVNESSKTIEELNVYKEKYLAEENNRQVLELEIRNLTEKLQNAKMNETSLKLQLENLNKEYSAMLESKNALEISVKISNESLKNYEENYQELQAKYEELLVINNELKSIKDSNELVEKDGNEGTKNHVENIAETDEVKILIEEKNNLQLTVNNLQMTSKQFQDKISTLETQLQELNNSRNELIAMVTAKHQESMTYHNEIQRLSQIIQIENEKTKSLEAQLENSTSSTEIQKKNEEIEKLSDQNDFLREKCDVLTKNLLEEQAKLNKLLEDQSKPSEIELNLNKKLERLQTHLVEVEDHYTQELLQAEQKCAELQTKLSEVKQREKTSSTMYTSVSIRANQQVEVLQSQLQMVSNQRDELRRKISDAEDLNNKQAAALANLQFVLQQFQRDKEKDVHKETERIRRQVTAEKQVQEELKKEISNLKMQLEETKQGLQAASRLSDQLENSKKQIGSLKDEVNQYQEKLSKTEEQLKNATSQTDGKVDKSLVKNLVIGFVSSDPNHNLNKDQLQILKIIATVLDFNQQEHDKVKLNKQQSQGGWLSSLLAPQTSQTMTQESLSQAFIRFLENESKPRVVPSLLGAEMSSTSSTKSSENSKRSSPRQSPIVLSEIVLPTFADFAQNRNSSSILKDVLKDNSG